MKAVAISIQKGGTGKTSISGNIAHLTTKKTLLIDADPQGSLSSWLLKEPPAHEFTDVLKGKVTLQAALVQLKEALWLLPTFGLNGGLRDYAGENLEKEPFIFQDLRTEARKCGIELLIYDLGPAAGRLERCVLLGCDEVVTPITPEYFSIDGIELFKTFLEEVRKYRGSVRHRKIVLNGINRSFRRHREYQAAVKDMAYEVFEIVQDAKLPEAQVLHLPLIDYAPKARSLQGLRRIAEAVEVD